jgi:hypothetical protein
MQKNMGKDRKVFCKGDINEKKEADYFSLSL